MKNYPNPSISNNKTVTNKEVSFVDHSTSSQKLNRNNVKRSFSSEFQSSRKHKTKAKTFVNNKPGNV